MNCACGIQRCRVTTYNYTQQKKRDIYKHSQHSTSPSQISSMIMLISTFHIDILYCYRYDLTALCHYVENRINIKLNHRNAFIIYTTKKTYDSDMNNIQGLRCDTLDNYYRSQIMLSYSYIIHNNELSDKLVFHILADD